MVRVMRRERPTIVHSMTPKAGLVSMLAAWMTGVPVRMHTYTGLVFPTTTGMKQRILIAMDRLLCACATFVNPEGRGVANDLQRFGITRKPLRIIGNGNVRGIDLQHWQRLPEHPSPAEGEFRFVFVGRLVGDKGINELITAFTALQQECPQVRLTLVGPSETDLDPLRPETLAEIDRNPAIEAVGRQSDVRPYYTAAHAFVFPSYREGFPNTVIEAGAMGLPSIVTDINGCNEIITHEENGLIVPPRNAEALHQAMLRMVTQPELAAKLASQARAMVADRFEQHALWKAILATYQELLQNTNGIGSRG